MYFNNDLQCRVTARNGDIDNVHEQVKRTRLLPLELKLLIRSLAFVVHPSLACTVRMGWPAVRD